MFILALPLLFILCRGITALFSPNDGDLWNSVAFLLRDKGFLLYLPEPRRAGLGTFWIHFCPIPWKGMRKGPSPEAWWSGGKGSSVSLAGPLASFVAWCPALSPQPHGLLS